MESVQEARDKVLAALKKADTDLTGPEICGRTGLHRNTVGKWLAVLKAEKRVEVTRKIGKTELYRAR